MFRGNALLLVGIVCCSPALLAQPSPARKVKERDLRYEEDALRQPNSPPIQASIPRGYALVVGIAKYQNLRPEENLQFSERDAEQIYSILISPEGGNFPAENVHKLIGPKATLANIRRELETWLPNVAQEDDRVLVYFAGHGFVDRGRAYLAPYDIERNKISETAYSMDALGAAMGGKIKAKWKVLLTDACHSGAIPADDVQTINSTLLNLNRSLFSLTASRAREQSYESPNWGGGHGIFTYFVVKGLEGEADADGDGIVTADELAEYVRTNVREATKDAEGGQQTPTSDRSNFDPNMPLAYNLSHINPDRQLKAPKYGTLIFEVNIDGVEIFLDGKSIGVVNRSLPNRQPGLLPGTHTIRAVKMGFEDVTRDEYVYPGEERTVTLKILIPVRRPRAALEYFRKGLEYYTAGNAENYRRAADWFQKALDEDPKYSQAALYLGRAFNALFDQDKAKKYFLRAIEIDPDYLEARASFAGMLLDAGDLDEAIRQLNTVIQREPKHAFAHYLLSQAFARKACGQESADARKHIFQQAIESARLAISLASSNAEAHFWLAESLRMSGSYREAVAEYVQYLHLSDFDSKLAGTLNYYVLGYLVGLGKKRRAAQHDIWKDLRSQAYFGICDCERNSSRWDDAISACQKSLAYDPKDPFAHYALALSFAHKANDTNSPGMFLAARKHFSSMLEINPHLPEAELARENIRRIDAALEGR